MQIGLPYVKDTAICWIGRSSAKVHTSSDGSHVSQRIHIGVTRRGPHPLPVLVWSGSMDIGPKNRTSCAWIAILNSVLLD